MIHGLVHEKGSKFHVDVTITGDALDAMYDKKYNEKQFYVSKMVEYRCQEIRGENFYIYKIEDLDVSFECQIYRHIARKIRIHCVKLADPKILLKQPIPGLIDHK